MKKVLTILLAVLMVMAIGVDNVFAESEAPNDVFASVDGEGNVSIISTDDAYITALCAANGSVDFCIWGKDRIYETLSTISGDGTEGSNIVKKVDAPNSIAFISKDVIKTYVYKGIYALKLHAPGYQDAICSEQPGLNLYNFGKDLEKVPDDLVIAENDEGKLVVSSVNTDYIKNICTYWHAGMPHDAERVIYGNYSFSDDYTKLFLDISDEKLFNGTCQFGVNALKYEGTGSIDVVLSHQKTKTCPDFDISFSGDDLIITCADTNWINGLVEVKTNFAVDGPLSSKTQVGTYGQEGYAFYFFDVYNWNRFDEECRPLVKISDTQIKFSASSQKSDLYGGQIMTGISYEVTFNSAGYTSSEPKTITFTNARKPRPEINANVVGEKMIISSTDKNYIGSIHLLCYYNENIPGVHGVIGRSSKIIDDNTIEIYLNSADLPKINEDTIFYIYADGYVVYIDNNADTFKDETFKATFDSFDVTYDANGGSETMDSTKAAGSFALPECKFIAPSKKHFIGWKINDDDILRFVKENIYVGTNTVIKAIWEADATPINNVTDSDITVGKVTNGTDSNKDMMKATLNNEELSSLVNLTPEEKAKGAAVWVETDETTTEKTNELVRGVAFANADATLMKAFEVNVFKKVKGEEAELVKETNGNASISIYLGDSQDLMDKAENGELYIYSIHDGRVTEMIKGRYDKTTKMYTFEADKFSIYGLVYIMNAPQPTPQPTPQPNNNNSKSVRHIIPNTGVN